MFSSLCFSASSLVCTTSQAWYSPRASEAVGQQGERQGSSVEGLVRVIDAGGIHNLGNMRGDKHNNKDPVGLEVRDKEGNNLVGAVATSR